ncbi:MAG: hypothetical protein HY506_01965 [Candidatus Yanofskybacteria bacterium]|nr:hypothetical protein [Candidatus Yanofskybacteria bacterium]
MSVRRCIKINSETFSSFLKAELKAGGRAVEESVLLYSNGFPVRVVQHYQISGAIAEVHLDADDLWLCLEGEATFVCGGRLAEPIRQFAQGELTFVAPSIIGGETVVLKKGDWALFPAGQPHQPVTRGLAHLAIIKRPAQEGRVQLDYLPTTESK